MTDKLVVAQRYKSAVPVDELVEHPRNPNKGDDEVVQDSIESNGFYGSILVQKSSGFVIAGNTRLRAMRAAGAKTVPVTEVDVDDPTALRIMVYDNQSRTTAVFDQQQLADVLEELASLSPDSSVIEGTGFTDADLAELLRESGEMGRRASGFLGGFDGDGTDDDDGGDATGLSVDGTQYFQLSFTLGESQREFVRRALRLAKERLNVEHPTGAQALVAIAKAYLAEKE